MTRKPRSHVKILAYRMWGIVQTRKENDAHAHKALHASYVSIFMSYIYFQQVQLEDGGQGFSTTSA